jgi:hypothetical protein
MAKLQTPSSQTVAHCHACEMKRRLLALAAAGLIAWLWFVHRVWFARFGWQDDGEPHTVEGLLLAAIPLVLVFCHWRWLKFKRRNSWVSWRDNDVYRLIAARWNGFLQRIAMK